MAGRTHTLACAAALSAVIGVTACESDPATAPPTLASVALARASQPRIAITNLDPSGTGAGAANWISDRSEVVGGLFRWTGQEGISQLPGFARFQPRANAINNRGEAVGDGCPVGGPRCYALFWTAAGELVELPEINVLHAINNRGQAVGAANGAVVWSPEAGVRYLDGGFFALDINERGDVVGQAVGFRAAVWPKGGALEFVPTPSGQQSTATGTNNAGDIVGFSGPHFQSAGFVWSEREGLRFLETPAGWYSHPEAINNRGDVVGWLRAVSDPTLPGTRRAVLWPAHGGLVELGGVAPGVSTVATHINQRGQIVGTSSAAGPVLWEVQGSTSHIP